MHTTGYAQHSSMSGSAWTRTSLEDENNMEDYASHTELLNMIHTPPPDPTQDTQQDQGYLVPPRHRQAPIQGYSPSPFQPGPPRRARRRRSYFSMSPKTSLSTYVCFRHLPVYQMFIYLCLRGTDSYYFALRYITT